MASFLLSSVVFSIEADCLAAVDNMTMVILLKQRERVQEIKNLSILIFFLLRRAVTLFCSGTSEILVYQLILYSPVFDDNNFFNLLPYLYDKTSSLQSLE